MDFPLKYIGQKARTFQSRYEEHTQAVSNNNGNSGCLDHILNTGNTYGCITCIMKVVKIEERENN
jgi:hypothetical protein